MKNIVWWGAFPHALESELITIHSIPDEQTFLCGRGCAIVIVML
mgnify:CR=1 FL=1